MVGHVQEGASYLSYCKTIIEHHPALNQPAAAWAKKEEEGALHTSSINLPLPLTCCCRMTQTQSQRAAPAQAQAPTMSLRHSSSGSSTVYIDCWRSMWLR
jgi:hypothetical protein